MCNGNKGTLFTLQSHSQTVTDLGVQTATLISPLWNIGSCSVAPIRAENLKQDVSGAWCSAPGCSICTRRPAVQHPHLQTCHNPRWGQWGLCCMHSRQEHTSLREYQSWMCFSAISPVVSFLWETLWPTGRYRLTQWAWRGGILGWLHWIPS